MHDEILMIMTLKKILVIKQMMKKTKLKLIPANFLLFLERKVTQDIQLVVVVVKLLSSTQPRIL
jgi:hypothetical protein